MPCAPLAAKGWNPVLRGVVSHAMHSRRACGCTSPTSRPPRAGWLASSTGPTALTTTARSDTLRQTSASTGANTPRSRVVPSCTSARGARTPRDGLAPHATGRPSSSSSSALNVRRIEPPHYRCDNNLDAHRREVVWPVSPVWTIRVTREEPIELLLQLLAARVLLLVGVAASTSASASCSGCR